MHPTLNTNFNFALKAKNARSAGSFADKSSR